MDPMRAFQLVDSVCAALNLSRAQHEELSDALHTLREGARLLLEKGLDKGENLRT